MTNIIDSSFLGFSECLLNDFNIFWQWIPHSLRKMTSASEISSAERLALTLRLFSTEMHCNRCVCHIDLKRVHSNIIAETCEVIYQCLKKDHLNLLKAPESQKIAYQFKENWNISNVIDAMDYKHIGIECPKLSCTQYYNYKGFYRILFSEICYTAY